jgi:hypothetical protein
MNKYLFFVCSFISLQTFSQEVSISKNIKQAMSRTDTNTIRSHIAYLADDKLKGRLPGTEGYQMAVDYVIDQYKLLGLLPAADDNGFTQKLVLRKANLIANSAVAVLKDKNGNIDSLDSDKDFTITPHPLLTSVSVNAALVFAGYGVEIPGKYSDFSGVDVKGKIVVIIDGAPDGLHSTLAAHFSRAGNKMKTIFSKGAIGVIAVAANFRTSSTPVLNVAMNPDKTIAYGRGSTGELQIVLNCSNRLLKSLFMHSGKNYDQVIAELKKGKPSSFELPVSLDASYKSGYTDIESYNLVGLIPGTDNKLKNEYVVHSAHLDHVGIGRPLNGDSIFNGAHDNASGVASLLEIARIYKTSGAKPRRSVLIVMVTAEEMGLLGSSYFAANPTVPKNSIVADINTDMPTVIAPLLSIVPLGAEHSSLMSNVKFAASYLGLDVENDPEPEQNRFVRSDQYSFVMNGIPALHIKYGNKSASPDFDLKAFVQEWRPKYYHKAADQIDGIFDFAAAKTYVQLNFLISYSIAQSTGRPEWNKGDLFAPPSLKEF